VSSPVPSGNRSRAWCVNDLHEFFTNGVFPGGNYTDEILDLDYSAQTASGDSWLYLGGSAVNISDSALGSGVALLVTIGPRIELITPAGDPVNSPVTTGDGQNEFVFDDANPGKLTIKLKAKVTPRGLAPEIAGRCYFTVGAIGNSMMEWASGNEGGQATVEGEYLCATVAFSGLPEHYWHFGTKFAAVYLDGERQDTERYEVFFPRDKKNHPGDDSGTTPNWYYYWMQTIEPATVGGVERYGGKGGSVTVFDPNSNQWMSLIRDRVLNVSRTRPKTLFKLNEGRRPYSYGTAIGFFAHTVFHERQHRANLIEWWPDVNTYDAWVSQRSQYDLDPDNWSRSWLKGDHIPDDRERRDIWEPVGPGLKAYARDKRVSPGHSEGDWGYGAAYGDQTGAWDYDDCEDYTLRNQHWPQPDEYATRDWASPWSQYNVNH
jgi:hypothetical protein